MFAYVGCRTTRQRNARGEGISVYRLSEDSGEWQLLQLLAPLVNPSFLVMSHSGEMLYAVHGDQTEVSAFRRDRFSGELQFLNRQNTGGRNPVHLAVAPGNRFLVVANYGSGGLAVLPILADGALGPVVDQLTLPGEVGPHRVEQPHARPHFCPFSPDGEWLLVPDKGLDRIFSFRLEAASGHLLPAPAPAVASRECAGPRHIVCHPQLAVAYVVNELDSTVTCYQVAADSGRLIPRQILPTLPPSFTGNSRAAEIAIDAAGRFVYTSNRGHDSIAVFEASPVSGLLAYVGCLSSGGRTPRFFALTPDGRRLYAANEDSDSIVEFVIDPHTGMPQASGRVIDTPSPVCIVFFA